MILLDTCVVLEPLKPRPEAKVLNWLDNQAAESLYISTISLAELLSGVAALPAVRRRSALSDDLSRVIDGLFAGRILSFDQSAAAQFPGIVTTARKRGFTISLRMLKLRLSPRRTDWRWPRATPDHFSPLAFQSSIPGMSKREVVGVEFPPIQLE